MLNTFNLMCCSSSVDESRSISDKFLMSLYRSQGLCILVFYLLLDKTVSNISFSFFFELQLQRNQKRRSTSAPPSIKRHPSNKCTPHPPPPPLADILNSRLFEEILFGKFSLFHLHSEYHNVILLPLVTSF